MNKVTFFENKFLYKLEDSINKFGEKHEILSVSICTEKHGYEITYVTVVTYKD